jgi:hypothetical protein
MDEWLLSNKKPHGLLGNRAAFIRDIPGGAG